MFSFRWTLVMRATLKQIHRQNPNKKHRLLRRGPHRELSKTLRGARIHLQREFCHKDRRGQARRALWCLGPAPLRMTRLSSAGQPGQEEDEPGGTWAGQKQIQWKSQTKWGPLMKISQKLLTSVLNSLGRQTPNTTLPQLITLVSIL